MHYQKLANMKNGLLILLISLLPTVGKADNRVSSGDNGVTFVVDKNLSPVKDERYYGKTKYFTDPQIIATSLTEELNLKSFGEDAFYQCVIKAYANHQSITLSPDMIWLLISQGFSRYVNSHAEQLRPLLVSHSGKAELEVESFKDLLKEKADWGILIDGFASKIGQYTKDDIAETITSDFTTTGPSERIASQITLMESLKTYFDYSIVYAGCGIPTITLKGTPDDWKRVIDKATKLEQYGLGDWIKQLRSVLEEFVVASEGNPHQRFWQKIVKKRRASKFKGGICSPKKPTMIDGWILTFFPDDDGVVFDQVPFFNKMPANKVYVPFEYRIVEPNTREVISKTTLELWAGFLGVEEDINKNMLTPIIGWYVCYEGEK